MFVVSVFGPPPLLSIPIIIGRRRRRRFGRWWCAVGGEEKKDKKENDDVNDDVAKNNNNATSTFLCPPHIEKSASLSLCVLTTVILLKRIGVFSTQNNWKIGKKSKKEEEKIRHNFQTQQKKIDLREVGQRVGTNFHTSDWSTAILQ